MILILRRWGVFQERLNTNLNNFLVSGTNANGTYYKFADGTLICTKRIVFSNIAITTTWGNLYTSNYLDLGSWAYDFTALPIRQVVTVGSSAGLIEHLMGGGVTQIAQIAFARPTPGTYTIQAEVIGIGRWKE